MTDKLVERLRVKIDPARTYYEGHEDLLRNEAADALEAQQARIVELEAGRAKAWYDATIAENKRRFAVSAAAPRIFIRHLRAPDKSEPFNPDDPLFEISEGRATELLAEREARAVGVAVAAREDRIRSLEVAGAGWPTGTRVRKKSGSWWEGRVVGRYSTEQTPDGYCVQLERPHGPVQIYPASALEVADDR